jgi:hypothetical protein
MAQAVQSLPSKCEALSWNLSATKIGKKKKKKSLKTECKERLKHVNQTEKSTKY